MGAWTAQRTKEVTTWSAVLALMTGAVALPVWSATIGANEAGTRQRSALALARPSVQSAQPNDVPLEVHVIVAAHEPGAVDARLREWLPQLFDAPFDIFGAMSVVEMRGSRLTLGFARDVALPNGRVLSVLVDAFADGRYRARISIDRPGESDYLPLMTLLASPDDPFFIAGQRFESGILIVAIELGALGA